jgi:hypothetical protein
MVSEIYTFITPTSKGKYPEPGIRGTINIEKLPDLLNY